MRKDDVFVSAWHWAAARGWWRYSRRRRCHVHGHSDRLRRAGRRGQAGRSCKRTGSFSSSQLKSAGKQ